MKAVFEIIESQQQEDYWVVGGLALGDILKDDILSNSEQPNISGGTFRIKNISTYGLSTEELPEGMTGFLTLMDNETVDLKQVKYLYLVAPDI